MPQSLATGTAPWKKRVQGYSPETPDGARTRAASRLPHHAPSPRPIVQRVLVLLYVYAAMIASTGAWLLIGAVHAEHSRLGQRRRPSIAEEVEVWLRQH